MSISTHCAQLGWAWGGLLETCAGRVLHEPHVTRQVPACCPSSPHWPPTRLIGHGQVCSPPRSPMSQPLPSPDSTVTSPRASQCHVAPAGGTLLAHALEMCPEVQATLPCGQLPPREHAGTPKTTGATRHRVWATVQSRNETGPQIELVVHQTQGGPTRS